jgi:hypothetical protein
VERNKRGKRKGVNEARCAFLAERDWRKPNKAAGRIWRTSIAYNGVFEDIYVRHNGEHYIKSLTRWP